MEIINFDIVMLVVMITSSFWVFFMISGYGGVIGTSFRTIGWGSIFLAGSHIFEELAHKFIASEVSQTYSLLYHSIELVGFLMIIFGLRTLVKK